MSSSQPDITEMLRTVSSGDETQLNDLIGAIYEDMRRIAANHLRSERSDHTLQPTALVHEAYLKLVNQQKTDWKDRAHFFAVASQLIRRILVDHARRSKALKRGADRDRVALDHALGLAANADADLVDLDVALRELGELNERHARIVELKFFGGLTITEIAEALSMGKRSVDREWKAARAWLFVRLSDA